VWNPATCSVVYYTPPQVHDCFVSCGIRRIVVDSQDAGAIESEMMHHVSHWLGIPEDDATRALLNEDATGFFSTYYNLDWRFGRGADEGTFYDVLIASVFPLAHYVNTRGSDLLADESVWADREDYLRQLMDRCTTGTVQCVFVLPPATFRDTVQYVRNYEDKVRGLLFKAMTEDGVLPVPAARLAEVSAHVRLVDAYEVTKARWDGTYDGIHWLKHTSRRGTEPRSLGSYADVKATAMQHAAAVEDTEVAQAVSWEPNLLLQAHHDWAGVTGNDAGFCPDLWTGGVGQTVGFLELNALCNRPCNAAFEGYKSTATERIADLPPVQKFVPRTPKPTPAPKPPAKNKPKDKPTPEPTKHKKH
jgi:hypothetical protein